MAYPTVSAPYGFKPVNLIGSQPFAGATRQIQIAYGYATSIYNGDFVSVSRGQVNRVAITTAGALNWAGTITAAAGSSYTTGAGAVVGGTTSTVGVFLGCSFTDPTTKQKRYSQYWPASTLAGDAVAFVCDDPDTAFKAAVVTAQGGVIVSSVAPSMIGQNLTGSDLAGNVNTGDSSNGLLYTAITQSIAGELTASAYPFRMVDVVRDTAVVLGTATYSSGGNSTTVVASANLTFAVPVGAQLSWIAPNGQLVDTGSFVATAITANNTANIVISNAPLTSITGTPTLVVTQFPEAVVKFNLGTHGYYTSIAIV
ncbi:MAG: hypothetical protein WCO52_06055 [bacterium]